MDELPNRHPRAVETTRASHLGQGAASSETGQHVPEDVAPRHDRSVETGGGDYAAGDIDARQGAFISGGTVQGDVIGVQTNTYYAERPARPDRNRRAMLEKVERIWITGLLAQSVDQDMRITLDLVEQPEAVSQSLTVQVQELKRPVRTLPAGMPIIDVFAAAGGALLILGAPGAGKTTLLLELTGALVARALQDDQHPVPVAFNHSSWATRRRSLAASIVDGLNARYDVPPRLGQTWIATDTLLP